MAEDRSKVYLDQVLMDNRQWAREAVAVLKACVLRELLFQPQGLRNVDVGINLGIYFGHEGHVGHISRSLLAELESEGKVTQDKDTKLWKAVLLQ